MTVSFELVPQDFLDFVSYVQGHGKWKQIKRVGPVFVIVTVIVIVFILSAASKSSIMTSLGSFLPIAFFIGVLILLQKFRLRGVADEYVEYCGAGTVSLTPEGVEITMPTWKGIMYWTGLKDTVETGEHIFLMHMSVSGTIIPKWAFSSPEATQEFIAVARRYWEAAKVG